MPISGLYKIINLENGKFYIGRSINIEKRLARHYHELSKNMHHCIHLQRAWNKYGVQTFDFTAFDYPLTIEEAAKKELYYLIMFKDKIYNISQNSSGGDLISYHPERDKIISKMKMNLTTRYNHLSEADKKRIYGKRGIQNGMYGKTHTKQAKHLISQKSKAFYAQNDAYRKGKTLEEVHGVEEAARLRKILSESAQQRIGKKNPFFGKHHSVETKKLISDKRKGHKPSNCRPVIIEGFEYPSVTEASRILDVVPATILYRIKSKNKRYHYYFYKDQLE